MLLPFRLLGFLRRDFFGCFLWSWLRAFAAVDVDHRTALDAANGYLYCRVMRPLTGWAGCHYCSSEYSAVHSPKRLLF